MKKLKLKHMRKLIREQKQRDLERAFLGLPDEWGVSVPFTEKLETMTAFDSDLVESMSKSMDRAVYEQFSAKQITYTPTGSK